jgi:hypothetical protein
MYEVVQGREVNDDDPSNPAKIPKTATDLHHPVYSLGFRLKTLDSLASARETLRDLETRIVFSPLDSRLDQSPDIHRRLQNIREQIKIHDLRVPCESQPCLDQNGTVHLYLNRCSTCNRVKRPLTVTEVDMQTIRNVIQRILFLEEKLSSSLSNQLDLEELETFLAESQKLVSIVR